MFFFFFFWYPRRFKKKKDWNCVLMRISTFYGNVCQISVPVKMDKSLLLLYSLCFYSSYFFTDLFSILVSLSFIPMSVFYRRQPSLLYIASCWFSVSSLFVLFVAVTLTVLTLLCWDSNNVDTIFYGHIFILQQPFHLCDRFVRTFICKWLTYSKLLNF